MKKVLAMMVASVLLLSTAGLASAGSIPMDTALTDVDGKPLAAKDIFEGKKTVVAFAQTACANCRQEISYLVSIAKDFPGVNFAVTIVDMRATAGRINAYLGELKFEGQILTDPAFKLASAVGVNQTPSLVMVDGKGGIAFVQAGYDEEAKSAILKALKSL